MRRKHKEIIGIIDSNGGWSENELTIKNMFISYFENLFTPSNPEPNYIENSLTGLQPKVHQAMNNKLMAPFTKTEVEITVKQMFPIKAPRPDGYSAIFYKKYWYIVGKKNY